MTDDAPLVLVMDRGAALTLVSVAADRCLILAKALENRAAIDEALLRNGADLIPAARALIDALPDTATGPFSTSIARFENALDWNDRQAAA